MMFYNNENDERILEFDIMYKEEKVGYVYYNYSTKQLIAESYGNYLAKYPWTKEAKIDSYKMIEEFLESRCFDRNRFDQSNILRELGLSYYEPLSIISKTHGLMIHDYNWIRFKVKGDVNYEDIKIRD